MGRYNWQVIMFILCPQEVNHNCKTANAILLLLLLSTGLRLISSSDHNRERSLKVVRCSG
jgi:hypothetical protein